MPHVFRTSTLRSEKITNNLSQICARCFTPAEISCEKFVILHKYLLNMNSQTHTHRLAERLCQSKSLLWRRKKNRLRQSNKLIISINLTTKSPHKQDDTSIKKHKQQQRPPNDAAANSVRTSRFAKPRLALDVRWQQPTDELGGRQNER